MSFNLAFRFGSPIYSLSSWKNILTKILLEDVVVSSLSIIHSRTWKCSGKKKIKTHKWKKVRSNLTLKPPEITSKDCLFIFVHQHTLNPSQDLFFLEKSVLTPARNFWTFLNLHLFQDLFCSRKVHGRKTGVRTPRKLKIWNGCSKEVRYLD